MHEISTYSHELTLLHVGNGHDICISSSLFLLAVSVLPMDEELAL